MSNILAIKRGVPFPPIKFDTSELVAVGFKTRPYKDNLLMFLRK
jgi:hypothetical protein